MAWSSYAHLPNREEEYWMILSNLKNGMSVAEVDKIIAIVKGKETVQHHYRRNLANIGLFDTWNGKICLNYDVLKLKKRKSYLKQILLECVLECKNVEFDTIKCTVQQEKTYDLQKIVDSLKKQKPELERQNLIRWIRPVVNLLKIVDILKLERDSRKDGSERFLQDAYLSLAKSFGKEIALEDVDQELKKMDESYNVVFFLERLVMNGKEKFKIELLMMPAWATRNKVYKINGDYYTHLRIKTNLV